MSYFEENIKWLKGKYKEELAHIEPNKSLSPESLLAIIKITNFPLEALVNKDLAGIDKLPFKNIKWVILDVDGTLTDGGMCFTEKGDEFKKFNTKDGMAISQMRKKGINVAFLSSGTNKNIVKTRAEMLGVKRFYCGKSPKMEILAEWMQQDNFSFDEIAYIGDDINDAEIMKNVAISACPADAVQEIKAKATIILTKKGGKACVREFYDEYLAKFLL